MTLTYKTKNISTELIATTKSMLLSALLTFATHYWPTDRQNDIATYRAAIAAEIRFLSDT